MKLPTPGSIEGFRPSLDTSTGGSNAASFKKRKKGASHASPEGYTPNADALASLAELKRERGLE